MRKIYLFTIVFLVALSFSAAFASAQTTTTASAKEDTGVHLDKWVEKISEGNYKLNLATYATGSSVTSKKVVSTPLDIVLVLDLSGSMTDASKMYTTSTDTYTSYIQDFTYDGYGTKSYYYKDEEGNYYLVSRGTYQGTDVTYNPVTNFTYSKYTSNAYCYNYGGKYYKVAKESESKTVESYTALQSADYTYQNYNGKSYYYKVGSSYFQVYRGDKGKNSSNRYYLYYKDGTSEVHIGSDKNNYNTTIYSGVLYQKSSTTTTYYYLSFTDDSNTVYYIKSDGTLGTQSEALNLSTTYFTGTLYEYTTEKYYYLKFTSGSTTYYLKPDGTTTTTQTGVSGTGTTIYSGRLYEKTASAGASITRLAALKIAVEAFINTVKDNAIKDTVNHRISIVDFGAFLNPKVGYNTGTWNTYTQPYSQVVNDLLPVATNAETLIQTVKNFTAGGSTPSDWGFMLANCVFDGEIKYNDYYEDFNEYPTNRDPHFEGYDTTTGLYKDGAAYNVVTGDKLVRSSNDDPNVNAGAEKIVVFFTDGNPYINVSGTERNVKEYAVQEALKLKNKGAKVYSVAVLKDGEDKQPVMDKNWTSESFDSSLTMEMFMNYVSSNYPEASSMYKPGEKAKDADYYKLADGDLTDIFVSIAESATSGGAKRTLDAETTTSIDYLTADFEFPAGTDASKIELFVDACTGYDTATKKYIFDTTGTRRTLAEFNGKTGDYVKVDLTTKKVSVTGFDYTKADVTSSGVTTYGNWVGPRTTKTSSGSSTTYKGYRLVYTIPIVPTQDYEGGYNLPTNTDDSGLYVIVDNDTTTVDKYPVPELDFPSIGIIKEGLKKGESAFFTIYMSATYHNGLRIPMSGTPYNVVLTATDNDVPAYTIIKDLPEGEYTVIERESWSWTYDVTQVIVKDATGTRRTYDNVKFQAQLLAKDMIDSWSDYGIDESVNCVLFAFTNEKKKPGSSGSIGGSSTTEKYDPTIYAESAVKNVFTGGNQTKKSATTTNSKTQPGESTQSTTPE